jgi:hypothetical protein
MVGLAATATMAMPQATPATSAPTTRAVYRLLQMKGLSPDEAASLTAFLCGLPTTDLHWNIRQLNQLLFLRSLRQTGRFGGDDGTDPRPH